MNVKLPFIPDLDKLFQTYDEIIGVDAISIYPDDEKNPYIQAMLTLKIIKIAGDGKYEVGKIDLHPTDKRNRILLDYLLTFKPVKDICESIGDEGASIAVLKNDLFDTIDESDMLVLLSWLERLKYIKIVNGKYEFNLSNEDDDETDEDTSSIYPLTYTKTVDISEDKFSVFDYLRKIRRNQIVMNPDFQRNLVWKPVQKSQFIESTILGIPIPPFYLKKENDTKLIIVDGLQRTSALMEFLNGDFKLKGLEALADLNGKDFNDLRADSRYSGLAARIEDKQLLFYTLLPTVPMSIVYDIFNRINTGGTKLNRQEIRNCIFIGNATMLLKDLSEDEIFKRAVDNGILPTRMKDREAILRCIAFNILPIKEYGHSMDGFLEKAMRKLNRMSTIELNTLKQNVLNTFNYTYLVFGSANFRIPNDYSRGRINIAVMETVFTCFWKKANALNKKQQLNDAFAQLLKDPKYLNSMRLGTGSKTYVETRFNLAHQAFDPILEEND